MSTCEALDNLADRAISNAERELVQRVKMHTMQWLTDNAQEEQVHETNEITEDLMCGLWNKHVVEAITGEFEAEEIGRDRLERGLLDKLHEAVLQITAAWTASGWETWTEDFKRRDLAEQQRELEQLMNRRQQLHPHQQDMRRFVRVQNNVNNLDRIHYWRDEFVG